MNAITAASGGDTLDLAAGCTYTLTSAYNSGTTGLPDVHITLIINGNGAIIERSSAQGTPEFRLFTVASDGNLTLHNLTIRNGIAGVAGQWGGGIYNHGGTLTVTDSTFTGNSATNNGGGAIFNEYLSTLTVNSSVFSNNTAVRGGAVENSYATATTTNSTFSNNSTSDGGGGAISNSNGTMSITGSTISDNAAQGATAYGGGVDSSGTLTVTNTTVSNNSADVYGGGIYTINGVLNVSSSSISGNTAVYTGGGINSLSGQTTITNSTISGNSISGNVSGAGGGIYFSSGTMTVNYSTIADNSAQGNYETGGAIYVGNGTITITNSLISGNSAQGATHGYGGGIWNNTLTAVVTIRNSTITGNSATGSGESSGGAIYNQFKGTITITNSTISGNSASTSGGGIQNSADSGYAITLGSTIVANNSAPGSADISGLIDSLGHSVIANPAGATLTGATATDLTGAAAQPVSLGALADNGGPTLTMALGDDSVAVSYGDCAAVTTDQRGAPRKPACDVGAYETGTTLPPPVTVTIHLPGRPNPPSPLLVVSLHVILTPQGGGAPSVDSTVTTDVNGQFTLSGVTPGSYHLWIKGDNLLAVAQDVTLLAGNNDLDLGTPPTGDTDGNNVVNLTDFSLLAGTFGKQSGNSGYDGRADFNGDTVVNLTDFSLLATSFGQSGAP